MLATYETDPVAALTTAMRLVSGRPYSRFTDIIHASHLPLATKHALCDGNVIARDDLVTNLNEFAGEPFVAAVSPL